MQLWLFKFTKKQKKKLFNDLNVMDLNWGTYVNIRYLLWYLMEHLCIFTTLHDSF